MASSPQFLKAPRRIGIAALSVANSNLDGSGDIETVFTADATKGSRVLAITVQATDVTTAGMVRLFIDDGTTIYLWREVPVSAATPSATVQAFVAVIDCGDGAPDDLLTLPVGYSLCASTHNAEAFNVIAVGGDY